MLDIVATGKLWNDPVFSRNKKVAWTMLSWLLPVLGFFLVREALGKGWAIGPENDSDKGPPPAGDYWG